MKKISSIIAVISMAFAGNAFAAVHTYEFGGSVINGTGVDPAPVFATLTVDDVSNLFTLSLANLAVLDPNFGANANASDLAMSYSGANPGVSGVSGGVDAIVVGNTNQPLGAFDVGFSFTSGGNLLTSGQPGDLVGESVSWTATGFDFSQVTSQGFGNFALRIQGSGQAGNGNGWYGSTLVTAAVPEPETYAMMLAGLGLIGFVGSRKRVQ